MAFEKNRIIVLSEAEYLMRLKELLNTTTLKSNSLIITGNSIAEATLLSQELADEILTTLDTIVDTDFTIELKNIVLDLWVLVRFLDISLDVLME